MVPPETNRLSIEVAFGGEDKVIVIPLEVDAGTSVITAVHQSGIESHFPGLDARNHKLGIFGCLVEPGTVLQEGDRVEIYRPLKADAKAIRRRRSGRSDAGTG